jgi:hypothetical protein
MRARIAAKWTGLMTRCDEASIIRTSREPAAATSFPSGDSTVTFWFRVLSGEFNE